MSSQAFKHIHKPMTVPGNCSFFPNSKGACMPCEEPQEEQGSRPGGRSWTGAEGRRLGCSPYNTSAGGQGQAGLREGQG